VVAVLLNSQPQPVDVVINDVASASLAKITLKPQSIVTIKY
jgi:hypothetical protein